MSDNNRQGDVGKPGRAASKGAFLRTRWMLIGIALGLLAGAWVGGGTDRYGEAEGVVGGLRGACGTLARGYRYSAATIRDCVKQDYSSVRTLGLERQIENRLWQDKRLAAEGIVVAVEDGGKAVLTGQVRDEAHKERAVSLVRDTRGVESVIDQLAVASASRTIDAGSSAAVPTGVASGVQVVR